MEWRAALLALITCLCLCQQTHGLACRHSGYCSLGQTKEYFGQITTSEGLRAALSARSFKREVILLVTTTAESQLVVVNLAVNNFLRLGIEHLMVIGSDQEACEQIATQIAPRIGCVWDDTHVEGLGNHVALWHVRYRTMARAVRMGFNVLSTDGDITIFHDPYRFFKSPPFNNFTIINQAEALYSEDQYHGNTFPNGGIIYVQNARPDGVAAYLLAEVSDRLLRWVDDEWKLLNSKGMTSGCGYMDQDMLLDAVSSVTSGRPHFYFTVNICWANAATKEQQEQRACAQAAASTALNTGWTNEDVTLPPFMHAIAGTNVSLIRYLPMQMPHTEGKWPEEFGGKLYPDTRGNLSSTFQKLLREDCGGCPMWPDPEDPATLAAARATPSEKYLYAPPWLIFGYWPRGSDGYWLPDAHGVVHQVIGHSHYLPTTDTQAVGKQVVKQVLDMFDWPLAHKLLHGHEAFFANRFSGSISGVEHQQLLVTTPRVLALHPHVHLAKVRSYAELLAVVHGAMQVATLSNRTLLWPDLPCHNLLVGSITQEATVEHTHKGWFFPYGNRAAGAEGLLCMLTRVLTPDCLYDLRGLLGTEWQHYKQRFGVRYETMPHSGNSVFIPRHDQLHGVLRTQAAGPGAVLVELDKQAAVQQLEDMAQEQVLYLAHPVRIKDYDAETAQRYQGCLSSDARKQALSEVGEAGKVVTALQGQIVDGRLQVAEGAGTASGTTTTPRRLLQWRSLLPTSWRQAPAGRVAGRQQHLRNRQQVLTVG